jgi:CDP-diacylglycerol--glycerol-3-phosphate 3-phosphatidyltransferase
VPSVYDLKPRFQAMLRPIVRSLAAMGVTANQVTLLAAFMSIAAGAALYFWHDRRALLILPAVLFLRMALNAVDGMLAREHNQKSALGAILNELCDVVSDAALYGALIFTGFFNTYFIIPIVILAIITEFAGVLGQALGASRQYQGPMGKSDRAFVFGLLALIIGLGTPVGMWLTIVLAVITLLLCITILNRCRATLRELRKPA